MDNLSGRARGLSVATRAVALAAVLATPLAALRHRVDTPHAIDTEHSTITIHVFKSGLFRAFADNHVIQAPVAGGSIDESGTPHVAILIEAQRLRVQDPGLSPKDREEVQARMLGPEVLDAAQFPEIRFQSTAVQHADADSWLVRGNLELHGRTREISVKVTRENGRYTGRTTLRQTDFGITPISIAAGTVKVKNEISIEFGITAAAPGANPGG